jgi:C1A family cysteine protease
MKKLLKLSTGAIVLIMVLSLFSSPILTKANTVLAQEVSPTLSTQPAGDESPTSTPTEEPQPTPTEEPTLTPAPEPTAEPTPLPTEDLSFEPASTPEEITPVVPGFHWSIRINGKSQGPSSKAIETLNSLKSQGIIGEFANNKLNLSGSRDIGQMKNTIFEGLPEGFDFLGGPVSLLITYQAEAGKEVTIRLEARTTTGYNWVLVPSTEFAFIQSGQSEYHARSSGLGVPSVQILRFTPNFSGTGTLHLAYQRAFEPNQPVDTEVQLTLDDQPSDLDLSDPVPLLVGEEPSLVASEGSDTTTDTNIVSAESLPATFDWRSYGVVPPVRNQGGCGSCWAFGTVGVMESAIKIGGGVLVDLSEQFLISCNNDGWSCNGGLTATKYHYNTLGKNQSAIGAVLESDKPYTATNGTCSIIANHPYKLSGWTFITGYEWKMPTVDQIKSAIYTYGPVTARVCAGSGWYNYSGGVYSTEDSASACSGSVNHQIILVGWNDANQTWILRNSWGSSWGDNGYMHIRWDTSRVGEGTSWVKYGDATVVPAAPAQVSPTSGTLTNDQTMTLTWSSVSFASNYDVQVDNNSDFTSPESLGISLTKTSFTTANLADAKYYWRVRAKNVAGTAGPWSTSRDFIIDFAPPDPPVLSSPTNGAEVIGTPTFAWLASVSAVAYQLQYETTNDGNPDTYIFRSLEITTLNYKPASAPEVMLPVYWSVRAKDNNGSWGAWSQPFTVTVVPPAPGVPTLSSPNSTAVLSNNAPVLSWASASYAATYEIQIDTTYTFPAPLVQEVVGITGLSHVIDSLPDGKYYWHVRAVNANNTAGSWSAYRYFTIDTTPPAVPLLSKPLNDSKSIGTPTFTWLASTTATRYQMQYETTIDGDPDTYLFRSPEITTLYYKPAATPELMVPLYWSVRARDTLGNWSAWSAPFKLTVVPPTPAAPVLLAPTSGLVTFNTTPELSWKAVTYADTYEIQIDTTYTFPAPLIQEYVGITGLSHVIDSLPDGKYYWHVRACNVNNTSGAWSAYRYFTIDTIAPAAPVLSKPLNGSQSIGTPTFTWLASATAKYYQVQYEVVDDSNPDTYDYRSSELTVLTHKPAVTLPLMTPLTWQVRAKDPAGNWSQWSAPWSVTVVPPVPAAPVLLAPASGLTTNNTTPALTWKAVTYADTYEIQIDTTYTFLAPLVQEFVGITGLSHVLDSLPDGKYYWHVRARNINPAAKPGPWSSYRYFTIDTTGPLAPVLSQPANNAPGIRTTPTFSWLASSTANAYQFQYAAETGFSDPVTYTSGVLTVSSHKPSLNMEIGTWFWSVRARDSVGNWGSWSAPRTLTILPPAVTNGGFEAGSESWTHYSSNGYAAVTSSLAVPPHSGTNAIWLGGNNNETTSLTQTGINMSGARYLQFWYVIGSTDNCGYDYARVKVNGVTVKTFSLCKSYNSSAWIRQVIDLQSYTGSTVSLEFTVTTNATNNSNFFVDDVSITNSSSTPTTATIYTTGSNISAVKQ